MKFILQFAMLTGLTCSAMHAQNTAAASPKSMPANVTPSFELATIKPSDPDLLGIAFGFEGRVFSTRNTSLAYLLAFSSDMQQNQIFGLPAWAATDKYDIKAEPDTQGRPTHEQLSGMIQNLLADRFKLTFHREKKELSAYVLVLDQATPKITPSVDNNATGGPGFSLHGAGNLRITNATMTDFARFMQATVLDRPVVDQTGLTAKYNFTLTWTPDDSQFIGTGMKSAPPSDPTDAPPDLFTAIQKQMGMKLRTARVPVDVLVIDHVEKPSAN